MISTLALLTLGSLLAEDQGTGYLREIRLIAPADLQPATIELASRELLERTAALAYVESVLLTRRKDVRYAWSAFPRKPVPMSYDEWKRAFAAEWDRPTSFAQILRVGDRAQTRLSDGSGVTIVNQPGADPVAWSIPGIGDTVSIILYQPRTPPHRTSIYCTARGLSAANSMQWAEMVLRHLDRSLGLGPISVFLRGDELFAGERAFPWRHLFFRKTEHPSVPTESEYEARPTTLCEWASARGGAVRCVKLTFGASIGYPHNP